MRNGIDSFASFFFRKEFKDFFYKSINKHIKL